MGGNQKPKPVSKGKLKQEGEQMRNPDNQPEKLAQVQAGRTRPAEAKLECWKWMGI